jgi:hypothetical protein
MICSRAEANRGRPLAKKLRLLLELRVAPEVHHHEDAGGDTSAWKYKVEPVRNVPGLPLKNILSREQVKASC